jgi:uncharacterized protein (DUF58 family)
MDGAHDPSRLRFEQNERASLFLFNESRLSRYHVPHTLGVIISEKRQSRLSVFPYRRGEITIGQLSQRVTPPAALASAKAYENE